ncbi:MAG: cell envelope integrity protein TolA [Deltaproteobacteria bacterium]|nr:cell envelope integrity protein TolA [Deltaproteobacteria bacterium]
MSSAVSASRAPVSWRSRGRLALVVALGLSAVLHVGFAVTVRQLPEERLPTTNRTAITVTFQPSSKVPNGMAEAVIRPHPAERTAPRPVERPDPPRPDGQIVRLPRTATPERPEQAKFVSEQDHKVREETRAREVHEPAPVAHEVSAETGAPQPPAEEPGAPQEHAEHVSGATAGGFRGPGWLAMWRAAQESAHGGNRGASDTEVASDADEGTAGTAADEGGRDDADAPRNLYPDDATAARVAGGAPANDALDDVEEGTGTYLNARQWKYASYFNRISEAVRRTWHPESVLRANAPDRSGRVRRRFTLVEITLDRDGRVVGVQVDRFSGNDDLDDEASRAVRAAGPFPNPPVALFEGADRFSFRFGFTVTFERQGTVVPFQHGLR